MEDYIKIKYLIGKKNIFKIYFIIFLQIIVSLSEIIGISSHQLSQCINRIYDKNFYDYINFHRVNEAKQLMQNSQYENFKIEVIGEKAGFNSRTTFFSVFKKFTGESPSAFKKNSSTF